MNWKIPKICRLQIRRYFQHFYPSQNWWIVESMNKYPRNNYMQMQLLKTHHSNTKRKKKEKKRKKKEEKWLVKIVIVFNITNAIYG